MANNVNPMHSLRMIPLHPDGTSTTLVAGLPNGTVSYQIATLLLHVPAHSWGGMALNMFAEVGRITRKGNAKKRDDQPEVNIPIVENDITANALDMDRTPITRIYAKGPSSQERYVHDRSKHIMEQWTGQTYHQIIRVFRSAHSKSVGV